MSREYCNEDFKCREELNFLHERSKVHFRSIPAPLLSDFEDFTSPEENYSKYKKLKNDLVQVQKRLSKMDIVEWHEITGTLHPANHVMDKLRADYSEIPLLTQAWMKFYEILTHFPKLTEPSQSGQPIRTLHLCEAPGAFISALVHYCSAKNHLSPDWYATSLNPWHEEAQPGTVINIDSVILQFPDRWFFGRNNTGDIFNKTELFENNAHMEFDLVTSDGGFDCSADPAAQEANSGDLKLAEYQGICHKLATHGSGVLKMFNCCHETSLQILESAANSFQSVNLVKPASSKAGNSELYLVMENYSGEMHPLQNSDSFLSNLLPIIKFFNDRQRTSILKNLETAEILQEQKENFSLLDIREARDYFSKELEDVINVSECQSHPWSNIQFWSSFHSFRRRKGNLDERQNKSQIALSTAISNFELKPLHIPRKKRFNDRPIHISNFEPLNSEERLSLIRNSCSISQTLNDVYLAICDLHPDWFDSNIDYDDNAELPLPFRNLSSDELNTFTLGKDFHNDYYEDQSAKSFRNIVVNVKATPFIPFPELLLRRAMISDLLEAIELIQNEGNLILNFKFITIASRLWMQIFSVIFMNFYSAEIIYYGAGSVIIWLRRFTGKSKNDIIQVLKRTMFDLSSYEVLEIYPYPELVQNDWFISTMRIFNNFMLESSLRILTKDKQSLQTASLPE